MKKIYFILILNCAFNSNIYAQGKWAWMNGDTLSFNTSVCGPAGVFDSTYYPTSYYELNSWIDKQGNLWYMSTDDSLWKYDISINQWAWIKSQGSNPNYGVKGVSSPFNTPGTRGLCALTWTDTSGCFWIFGGQNPQTLADLWKFDPQINEWTWMSGSDLPYDMGNFGVQGVPSVNNYPCARSEVHTSWVDSLTNTLWLFGGAHVGSIFCHDVWKYEIATNEWTWMKGDTTGTLPIYGQKKIPDPANTPGGLCSYSKWTDDNGDFWLFAGWKVTLLTQNFNNVWRYQKSTNCWTWMNGGSPVGFFSGNCYGDSLNIPYPNFENKSCWKDACGIFYTLEDGNILWAFNPITSEWSVPKDNGIFVIPLHYGTKGIPDAANNPQTYKGAESWTDRDGNFWYLMLHNSTMWKYTPDIYCTGCTYPPSSAFVSAQNVLCPGTCTNFQSLSEFSTTFLWSFPGAFPDTSTAVNPTNICYPNSGSFDVQLIVSNTAGTDTLALPGYIIVYPSTSQSIVQSGDTLFANTGVLSYQWFFNGSIINGATDYFYVAHSSGDYNVIATDTNGCEVEAVINDVLVHTQSADGSRQMAIYPNPVVEMLSVIGYSPALLTKGSAGLSGTAAKISIYNVIGEKFDLVVTRELTKSGLLTIDCRPLPKGIYFLELCVGEKIFREKFIKQ